MNDSLHFTVNPNPAPGGTTTRSCVLAVASQVGLLVDDAEPGLVECAGCGTSWLLPAEPFGWFGATCPTGRCNYPKDPEAFALLLGEP